MVSPKGTSCVCFHSKLTALFILLDVFPQNIDLLMLNFQLG